MKHSPGDKGMLFIIYVLLICLSFITLYPFWNSVVISLNSGSDTSLGGYLLAP